MHFDQQPLYYHWTSLPATWDQNYIFCNFFIDFNWIFPIKPSDWLTCSRLIGPKMSRLCWSTNHPSVTNSKKFQHDPCNTLFLANL